MKNKPISKAFFLKYSERILYQGVTFIVNIILARILGPEYYGILALLMVFIIFSQVFVQTGLSYSLVQSKNITNNSINSLFTLSTIIMAVVYILLFILSPLIESFYKIQDMSLYLRVLSLVLFPIAYNSIQNALIARKLLFKLSLLSSLISSLLSGIISIYLALNGFGIWSLIFQQLIIYIFNSIFLTFYIPWKPKFYLKFKEISEHIKFGWKLFVGSIFMIFYQESTTIIIGRYYSPSIVGFYNKGAQFPKLIALNLNSSIQSVLFSVMSRHQDNKKKTAHLLNKSISIVSGILFPALIGLAAVSNMLIEILLTNEWSSSVVFVRLMSIFYIFQIITTTNTQAILSIGRSGIVMLISILKSILGISVTMILILLSQDIIYIVVIYILMQVTHYIVISLISSKLFDFSVTVQYKNIIMNGLISIFMGIIVSLIPEVTNFIIIDILLKITSGIIIYVILSITFKSNTYINLKELYIKTFRKELLK